MKVLVIVAVVFTLTTLIECRHLKSHKRSEISKTANKRQYDPYHSTCCSTQHVSPPVQNCCQGPHPPSCCATVPDYSTIQGCCSTVQTQPTQPPTTCCQQPNPPPCCLNLHLKAGEEKNISTANAQGQNFILNVKLIAVDGNPCTTATTTTTTPTPTPTPTPTTTGTTGPTASGGSTTSGPSTGVTTTTTTGGQNPLIGRCQKESLDLHNRKRAVHNARDLTLVARLNILAQRLADGIASRKETDPDDRRHPRISYGRNYGVECFSPSSNPSYYCRQLVRRWYDEAEDYDWKTTPKLYSEKQRHFTQMVWKATLGLGIGYAIFDAKNGEKCHVVVATYVIRGNNDVGFDRNVDQGSFVPMFSGPN